MFGMGMGELLLIMVVALLALGPDRLPGAAKTVGKAIRGFRRQSRELQDTLEQDTKLGDAMRELRSAMHGDPARPPPKQAPRPPQTGPKTHTASAGPDGSSSEGKPAPAPMTTEEVLARGPDGGIADSGEFAAEATKPTESTGPRVVPAAGAVSQNDPAPEPSPEQPDEDPESSAHG